MCLTLAELKINTDLNFKSGSLTGSYIPAVVYIPYRYRYTYVCYSSYINSMKNVRPTSIRDIIE